MARTGLTLAACAVALGAAGCGAERDGQRERAPVVRALGPQVGGSVAQLSNCSHWRGGAYDRKLATIADVRSQVSRTDSGITTPPLSDAEAMALFDRACAPRYADDFRLYVLYARAAGFAPLRRGR